MTMIISRLYDEPETAAEAVQNLEAAGLPSTDISMIANNADNWYEKDGTSVPRSGNGDGADNVAEDAETGATLGVLLGGTAGLLAGLGVMAIPGVGPVVAAGWLAATAAGAAVGGVAGGATGGIVGALTQSGVPHEHAHVFAEAVRRGGTLVSARVPDAERSRYEAILDRSSVDIQARGESYTQAGWKAFDPNARPYSAGQAQAERETYGNSSTPVERY